VTGKDQHIPSEHEVRQWLILISQADQSSFTLLMRTYWNKVYTQAITYLKSTELAQEITQDVFIKLWAIREKLTEVNNFSNFLFILSRNEIITALRKKKEGLMHLSDEIEELILQPDRQRQRSSAAAGLEGFRPFASADFYPLDKSRDGARRKYF